MSLDRTVLAVPVLIPLVVGGFALGAPLAAGAQKLTPATIVERHIEQTFARAAAEASRKATGTCVVSSLMGAGVVEGGFELASTPDMSRLNLRFGIPTYEGESIEFDGREVSIGFAQRRTNTRSALGLFLSTYSVIVRDGLFGGVLNRRWPLRDLAARDPKLSYDGVKKLEGRDLHRMRYGVKRNQGDLTVHLYFEPETFRHVATVYAASRGQDASALDPTAQQADDRYTVSETFSDFESTAGGSVPKAWLVHYVRTGEKNTEWKYDCTVQSVASGS